MGREIKFRAWDKEKSKLVDAKWRMSIDLNGNIIWEVDHLGGNLRLIERERTDGNDRFELMQYTGLLDKNGKEIYEGDLIKVDDEHIYAISYRITDSGFVAGNIYGFDEWDLHYLSEFYEVIGNVYENPDLLGGEE